MSDAPNVSDGAVPVPENLDKDREFLVSAAPHLSDTATTRKIMFSVILAMVPMFAVSVYMYHQYAVILTAASVAGCLFAEAVANWMRGRNQSSLGDGSAILTGMILAFSVPPGLQPYMAFVGGAIAIALGKAVFGGLGQNLFNPAMVGRAFLMICFPVAMGAWLTPIDLADKVDGVTMSTPLAIAQQISKDGVGTLPAIMDLFIGKVGGCVGETSALAALIGGLYLVIRKIADWRLPLAVLVTVAVFALITLITERSNEPDVVNGVSFYVNGVLFHLTSGALMFGAFFIATDYVGAPITPKGRWIFGIGVGLLVMIIRKYGTYPEGFMFAILLMNAVTPLIERWTTPTPYGGKVDM